MLIQLLISFFLIFLLYIYFLLRNINYIYDLSKNIRCNIFQIYNLNLIINLLPTASNKIFIDKILPNGIQINNFPQKGWGLIIKKDFKKNEIIYNCPIEKFPNGEIVIISKTFGEKKIDKNIHLGELERRYNIICHYDCFLNHDNLPTAYHDISILISDNKAYITLKATKDIKSGSELTIDYKKLNISYIYLKSFISLIKDTNQSFKLRI